MAVDPKQMMPPARTPVVGNSLQQLAAMRANRGQVPALGNVQPMQPMTQTTGIPMAMPEQNMDIKQNLNEMLTATLPATVENVQKKHSTLLTVSDIKINLNFSDDIFHTKTIKRMPLID